MQINDIIMLERAKRLDARQSLLSPPHFNERFAKSFITLNNSPTMNNLDNFIDSFWLLTREDVNHKKNIARVAETESILHSYIPTLGIILSGSEVISEGARILRESHYSFRCGEISPTQYHSSYAAYMRKLKGVLELYKKNLGDKHAD